jgi:hypothetical protein
MSDINWKWLLYWFVAALALVALLSMMAPPVSAYPYVYQGDILEQGKVYDISGVTAFGEHYGEFAYWKDWWQEGGASTPTIINRIEKRYLYSVCIDPDRWKVGNWYKYNGEKEYKNENNFAFSVVKGNSTNATCHAGLDPTPVPTAIIYDITGVPTTPIPTETEPQLEPTSEPTILRTAEPTPAGTIILQSTPTPTRVATRIVTGATPTFPPPRGLPLSPIIVLIGLIGAIIIVGRR